MITRKDYMSGKNTHREYYAQFVTEQTKAVVARSIGLKAIKKSVDPHFNDIPLVKWDILVGAIGASFPGSLMEQAGDYYTLGGAVCIAKEAAQQLKEAS